MPVTEWGAGDLNIEERVHREVATPGRQIGILEEAVLALARHMGDDAVQSDEIKRLQSLVDRVEEIKAEVRAQTPPLLPKI